MELEILADGKPWDVCLDVDTIGNALGRQSGMAI